MFIKRFGFMLLKGLEWLAVEVKQLEDRNIRPGSA